MGLNAYLTITGAKQGKVAGSVTLPGREGTILVVASDHELTQSHDPASGIATGHIQHKPYVIVKEVDASSPLLYQLFSNNENLTEWKLSFWRTTTGGQEVKYYEVALENATIGAIKAEMLNTAYPENASVRERERVAFYYERITWNFADGSISSTVDWVAPTV